MDGEVGGGGAREAANAEAGDVRNNLGGLESGGVGAAGGAVDGGGEGSGAVLVDLGGRELVAGGKCEGRRGAYLVEVHVDQTVGVDGWETGGGASAGGLGDAVLSRAFRCLGA